MEQPTPQQILDDPRFLYTTRPGLGRVSYVFQDRVCVTLSEALRHVAEHELSSPTGPKLQPQHVPDDGRQTP